MLTLRAPATSPVITLNLPDSELGNSNARDNRMSLKQAMAGDFYTYVRTNIFYTVVWNVTNVPNTDLETLLQALKDHAEDTWSITDHDGTVWAGTLLTTPWTYNNDRRAFDACEESGTITINFVAAPTFSS